MLLLVLAGLTMLAALPARSAPFAATVMDARTGQILHSVNDTTRLHPASLTKMMTLYVVFEAIRNGEISLDTMVRISRRAASEPPSRLGLREGQRVAVRHLIRAAALRSGNDAATALAEAVSGSVEAFARRMNRTAAAIGMTQTTFRNAHGLTQPGHLSTARDMTILGRQLYFDFPEYYGLFSRRSEDAGLAVVANTNARFLDSYPGADGIKTGYTSAAGYNLTAMAERNGVRLVVTVFGGRSIQHRHDMVTQLMDRGFRDAPARVAVRRPPRPDYARPATRAPEVAAASAGSRAAGRVIRLQTAPPRSPFPLRRPAPEPVLPPALAAAVQQGVETALAESVPPGPANPSAPPAAPPIAEAPARAPVPPARPVAALAGARPGAAPGPEDDVQAARAAGFTVIDTETFAALTAAPAPELPPPSAPPPAPRAAAPDPAPEPDPAPPATVPATLPATVRADAPPEASPDGVTPAAEPASDLAAVQVIDGAVVIPGLPPISLAEAPAPPEVAPAAPPPAPPAAEVAPAPEPPTDPPVAPRSEPALVVTAEGQILWHDQDLLTALEEIAPPVGPVAMVLTVEDPVEVAPAPVLPEIVVHAATSGGRLWGVDLGVYGSRFDAERTLLRAALAESTALGGGVRRVEPRGSAHRALVVSLTEEQASLACRRLTLAAQPCTVLAP